MDIRPLTDTFAVAPQITPDDIPALAEAGFVAVICNRPDTEVSGAESSASIEAACSAAGLSYTRVPVDHSGISEELIVAQRAAMEATTGPVLGYCRSGTRSAHIWAMARATQGDAEPDALIAAGARGGYDLTPLRPALTALSER